jgi:hypothetical protein
MAKKIVEYALLSNNTSRHPLTEGVNAMLKEGWSLYGSPMACVAMDQYGPEYRVYQAMVKYETS